MWLRTIGASRLYIAKLATASSAIAAANNAAFFQSCGHQGVRRTGTTRTTSAGMATTTTMLARKVQPSRSRISRGSVCIVLASIAVSMTTP